MEKKRDIKEPIDIFARCWFVCGRLELIAMEEKVLFVAKRGVSSAVRRASRVGRVIIVIIVSVQTGFRGQTEVIV